MEAGTQYETVALRLSVSRGEKKLTINLVSGCASVEDRLTVRESLVGIQEAPWVQMLDYFNIVILGAAA